MTIRCLRLILVIAIQYRPIIIVVVIIIVITQK